MEKRPVDANLEVDTFEDRRDRGPFSNPTHRQPFPRPDG